MNSENGHRFCLIFVHHQPPIPHNAIQGKPWDTSLDFSQKGIDSDHHSIFVKYDYARLHNLDLTVLDSRKMDKFYSLKKISKVPFSTIGCK